MGRRQKDSAHPPNVRPLDVDGVRTVAIVTVGWGVAFVVLALRQGQLNDAGNGWWLWTCLAGVGLGLLGLEYCRKRRDAIARAELDAEAEAGEFDDDSAVGDWSRLPPEEDLDSAADEPPVPASADHITRPYQHGERAPGYTNGEVPAVNRQIGSPEYGYGPQSHPSSAEPHTPQPAPRDHEPEQQRPADRPQAHPAPHAAPAPQQPSPATEPVHSRQAAQRPGPAQQPDQAPARQARQQPPRRPQSAPQQQPNQPVRQPPQPLPSPPQSPPQAPPPSPPQAPPPSPPQAPPPSPPQAPPSRPQAPPPQQPRQPEPEPADPYSTGAGWYDSAAGYTPDADRGRRHPRDRRADPPRPSGSAAEPPAAGSERPGRRSLEDSEFFGGGSGTPPPNSTAEFLLADLQGDDEQPPPARHDRDAPNDEYRSRRARGSR